MKGLAIRDSSTLTVENISTIARKYTELVEEDGRKFGFESFLQIKNYEARPKAESEDGKEGVGYLRPKESMK